MFSFKNADFTRADFDAMFHKYCMPLQLKLQDLFRSLYLGAITGHTSIVNESRTECYGNLAKLTGEFLPEKVRTT
jgi:hypothetical protein